MSGDSDPTWRIEVPMSGPPAAGLLRAGVQCHNVPVGSSCQFTIPGGSNSQGSWPPVDSGKFPIEASNQTDMEQVTWPANVETEMSISWWANGTTPQPDTTLAAVMAVGEGNAWPGDHPVQIIEGTPNPLTPS